MRVSASLICLAAFLSAVALLAPGPGSSAIARADEEISVARIGTWNIEWLGRPEKRGDVARNIAQDPADIARYIVSSKVDILGLNEITQDGNSIDPPTNRTLTEALEKIKGITGKTWKHMLFPKEDRNDRDQWVGVAWNTDRAELLGPPARIPIRQRKGTEGMWHRYPYAVKFS